MNLKIEQIGIDQQALTPTLKIGVYLEFGISVYAPISISGRLVSSDNKILSFLDEYQIANDMNFGLRILTSVDKDKIWREKSNHLYYAQLIATLSPIAIEYIEKLREKDPEKSVRFNLDFVIKFLDLPAASQEIGYDLISVNIKCENLTYVIKQSDWVKNYSPLLGIGNFLLLELIIPENQKIDNDWKGLYERSLLRLTEMNEAIRVGDWQKTMSCGRQFYENLKIGDKKDGHKKFEDELRNLFEKDQHSAEGTQNFLDGIWKFFEYNSKFVHDKDKAGNLNPIPITGKEDAYFIYALAVGLLNIIGKKVSKGIN